MKIKICPICTGKDLCTGWDCYREVEAQYCLVCRELDGSPKEVIPLVTPQEER